MLLRSGKQMEQGLLSQRAFCLEVKVRFGSAQGNPARYMVPIRNYQHPPDSSLRKVPSDFKNIFNITGKEENQLLDWCHPFLKVTNA